MDDEFYCINDWYKDELKMISSSYPLAREYISKIKELLNDTEEGLALSSIEKLPESYFEILGRVKPEKLIYFTKIQKQSFKVFTHENHLCFLKDKKYVKVDSDSIFKEFFGRTWEEDEKYLANIGYAVPDIRKGKSQKSCFIIDMNNDFFIFPYRSNTIQHTSISFGYPVKLAGTIRLIDGKISYIDNSTGHYRANIESLKKMILLIRKMSDIKDISSFFTKDFNGGCIGMLDHKNGGKHVEAENTKLLMEFQNLISGITTQKTAY